MIEIIPFINYEGKLLEIQKLLNSWSKRHLTHLGKIESHQIAGCLKDNLFNDGHPTETFIQELERKKIDSLLPNKDKIKRKTLF